MVASAPAPLMPTPAFAPTPTARAAATDLAVIVELVVAAIAMPPDVVLKELSAFLIPASTSFETRLEARETPMEPPTPATPPPATERDAAPALALIVESSLAVSDALVA